MRQLASLTASLLLGLCLGARPADAQGLERRVTQLESTVSPLPGRVATLEAARDALESELHALHATIANLPAAPPLDIAVDCSAGETVQGALAAAGERSAHVLVRITGFCDEHVFIDRPTTTLAASTDGDGLRRLDVVGPRWVALQGLRLDRLEARLGSAVVAERLAMGGGTDAAVRLELGATASLRQTAISGCAGNACVYVGAGSTLAFEDGRIEGATGSSFGVVAAGGSALLSGTEISRFGQWGAWVHDGGTVTLSGGSIHDNGDAGAVLGTAAHLALWGVRVEGHSWAGVVLDGGSASIWGSVVRANGSGAGDAGGVRSRSGGRVAIRESTIAENRGNGIEVRDRSQLTINNSTIRDNSGNGIVLGSLSHMEASLDPIAVMGNGAWGIACETSARYRDYRALVVTGNASGEIATSCVAE